MKTYTIYKLTAPNDEVYIGQTSSLEKRFYYYKSKHCKTQFLICNSINKYGWEAFKKEIVETGLSKDKANFLEVSLIKEFKDKKISLNILNGGEETKTHKEVIQFDLFENFIKSWKSAEEAGKQLNIRPASIRRACKGKNGYNRYSIYLWLWKSDFDNGKLPKRSTINFTTCIVQLNLKGKLLNTFSSIKEASIKTGILYQSIYQALYRKDIGAGYKWLYQSEYDENKDNSVKTKKGKSIKH